MLIERYFTAIQGQISKVAEQTETIQQVAQLCAETLTRGGVVHIFDSGHLVSQELVHRAGGLVALSPLTFSLNVTNTVRTRPEAPAADSLSYGYIQHVFETNQLRPGDVLFVGSVSGKTANVIELALQAKAHGLSVVGLTARAYSERLESEHPSGKHLYEVTDLVLDNGAPYGDAMIEVEGLDYPVLPASGIGAAVVMWAVVAGMIEDMLNRGVVPSVFPSVNRPNGRELVSAAEAQARQKGY